jgi:hypothetical protein
VHMVRTEFGQRWWRCKFLEGKTLGLSPPFEQLRGTVTDRFLETLAELNCLG